MTSLPEIRVRTKLSDEAMQERVAKILTPHDYAYQLNSLRASQVRKPDGTLLCVYLPGALKSEMDVAFPILTKVGSATNNRGNASGTEAPVAQNKQLRSKPVTSAIIGSFEASGYYKYCRLTSWTAKQLKGEWPELFPLFQASAARFEEYVPDRFAAQMKFVRETPQEWCIQGTPYTTCTVNDTYPTGVHQDAGDLDEGFSCLTVARRGSYTGGFLTFPRYEVAVDMQDGDLILMNAHDWHGNTAMQCECGTPLGHSEGLKGTGPCKACGAQRISVVLYYRTNMARCGTQEQEQEKAIQRADALNAGPQAPAQDRSVTPAPPIPTLSPEQRAAEAKAYRESRGEPEPLTLG